MLHHASQQNSHRQAEVEEGRGLYYHTERRRVLHSESPQGTSLANFGRIAWSAKTGKEGISCRDRPLQEGGPQWPTACLEGFCKLCLRYHWCHGRETAVSR